MDSQYKRLKVLIGDDHQVVREGLRMILGLRDDIQVVGEASDGHEVIALAEALRPDVILMDLRMSSMNGVEATKHIKDLYPEMGVIVLTGFGNDEYVFQSLEAGADGFLLKDASPEELTEAIRRVAQGESMVTPSILRRVLDRVYQSPQHPEELVEHLTKRELEILAALAQGMRNAEIAQELHITERTVKTHLSHIFAKIQARGRVEAILYALREGLVEVPLTSTQSRMT
ncbi:MAG: response regulator transcription factor [Chloroflexi bacterium]|nr:response regulator transcription factor [Chloroflexota bacterium]